LPFRVFPDRPNVRLPPMVDAGPGGCAAVDACLWPAVGPAYVDPRHTRGSCMMFGAWPDDGCDKSCRPAEPADASGR